MTKYEESQEKAGELISQFNGKEFFVLEIYINHTDNQDHDLFISDSFISILKKATSFEYRQNTFGSLFVSGEQLNEVEYLSTCNTCWSCCAQRGKDRKDLGWTTKETLASKMMTTTSITII